MSYLEDPRVFFAAERTCLAWLRTSITLIGLGFVIEKFALFMRYINPHHPPNYSTVFSLIVSVILIVGGVVLSIISAVEYKRFLKSLKPVEIPPRYNKDLAFVSNLLTAFLGIVLVFYIIISNI